MKDTRSWGRSLTMPSRFVIYYNNRTLYCEFQNPKVYVDTILHVHKRYAKLVRDAFGSDTRFLESLDKVRYKLKITDLTRVFFSTVSLRLG